jgi:hypothetical protein
VEVVAIGPILDEGLTFNPSTLTARRLLGPEDMIHNRAIAHLTMGATTTMKEGDNREGLARESAGHAGRHLQHGGDGAGDYRATARRTDLTGPGSARASVWGRALPVRATGPANSVNPRSMQHRENSRQ